MKTLFFAIMSTLFITTAYAGDHSDHGQRGDNGQREDKDRVERRHRDVISESSSWESIFASRYHPRMPQVQFDTTFVGIDNVCYAGDKDADMLYTIKPILICNHAREGRSSSCIDYTRTSLKTPIDYKVSLCSGRGHDCEIISKSYALSYRVNVYENTGREFSPAFSKVFHIPECQ